MPRTRREQRARSETGLKLMGRSGYRALIERGGPAGEVAHTGKTSAKK
jgi:hypothetical protein